MQGSVTQPGPACPPGPFTWRRSTAGLRCRPTRQRAKHTCRAALAQAQGTLVDYYELLNVDDDASLEHIKASYRYLAKECHPDYLGDEGHDMCVLLNEAYSVLSDPQQRQWYNARLQEQLQDGLDDYTGDTLSKWLPINHPNCKAADPAESRAVFVDEFECIGCKQCVWCASATFRIEPQHGRSRVFAQWLDTENTIQDAMDSCPVSCIHWVPKQQLPALEYVMQRRMGRMNVGIMMGSGGARGDVWSATERFLKERRKRLEQRVASAKYSPAQEAARTAAAEQVRRQAAGWWGSLASAVHGAFSSAMDAAGSHVGPGLIENEVGRRRRRRQPPLNPGQGTIPLERSLVPIRVQDRM